MIDEHDDCYCCYLCNKFFDTKQSLKYHNEFICMEYCNVTESEGKENLQISIIDAKQKHKQKKLGKLRKESTSKLVKMDCVAPLHQ